MPSSRATWSRTIGTTKSPRIQRYGRGSKSSFGLDDLIEPIKDDLPELMKAASASAKSGNATVLAALINLFAKHAEGQVGEKASEVFKHVQDLRAANLQLLADNENGSKGT